MIGLAFPLKLFFFLCFAPKRTELLENEKTGCCKQATKNIQPDLHHIKSHHTLKRKREFVQLEYHQKGF